MFRQAPSFPYHDLGIVEDGNTASRAISKDAYVIWKGESYFASTDILQGATLEEDVNLTAIPDGVINGVVDAVNSNFTTGTAQLSSIAANSNLEATVSFGKTFVTPPVVFTQAVGPYQGNEIAMGGLVSVSETEFKIRVRNTAASAYAPKLNWLAIGK